MEIYGRDRESTDDDTIRRMCIACWINRATDIIPRSYYILVFACLQQRLLHERTSMLCSLYLYFSPYLYHDVGIFIKYNLRRCRHTRHRKGNLAPKFLSPLYNIWGYRRSVTEDLVVFGITLRRWTYPVYSNAPKSFVNGTVRFKLVNPVVCVKTGKGM